ncbi:glycosyl transferase [Candidatus Methylacidiphilum fumarolicum]|jgi:hypothetical protein|uniref:Glycosyltransferase n=2 Tax=Candidatus Methylacidiphilum fumarolicum TaxID=591154 RepID=I0JZA7_METFB|nr:class I SAM-dependent methyltransferase [Candidatus Methylacidiphilum fumarolicum]TFE70132.1 glycosyl transferase [Candidatus Methylacidiphilum fumarolicum]TFE74300.1 glycosyl transferase [Candidatus Methylacidiphilum fumarolicum]TFE75799.1 glycosyl transferase [Candidatus Methylacidiphilum fumarolicum]TFE75959.1 glycosyl transferase [Candidatus Methylacidiphilum fumarolicum]CAI9084723.1 Glycosyltransferase [Candidatus Methylacidiphilum fumarolicum]
MTANTLNPFCHPILSLYPERLTPDSAWHSHIPFAFWVTAAAAPQLFVEIGLYKLDSYCAFCQAVKYLHYPTACYGIDHWNGDENTPPVEKEEQELLEAYHYPRYGSFSKLLSTSFDDALDFFKDGSIDLLHIDGSSTYPSVRHNFEKWLPKMSDRGIVLLHGTNARGKDYGSWLYWEEIKESYPYFHFLHGYGLGVLAVGKEIAEPLKPLFDLKKEEIDVVRSFFMRLGEGIEAIVRNEKLRKEKENLSRKIKELETNIQESAILRIQFKEKEKEATELAEKIKDLEEKEKEFCRNLSVLTKLPLEEPLDLSLTFNSLKEFLSEQDHQLKILNEQLQLLQKEKEALQQKEEELNKIKQLSAQEKTVSSIQSPIKTPKTSSTIEQLKVVIEKEPTPFDSAESLKKTQLHLSNLEKEFHTYQNRLIEEIRRINCLDAKRLEQQCKMYRKTAKKNSFFACLFNPKAREENKLFEKVLQLNLFDPDFYVLQAPDVPKEEALRHYIREGYMADLNPNPYFDTAFYIKQNPEVTQQNINPLIHYIEEGAINRKNPSPYFDTQYYLEQYPEVAEQQLNPLSHFLIQGRKEGRLSRPILKIGSRMRPNLLLREASNNPPCPVCGKELPIKISSTPSHDQILCPYCHSKELDFELSNKLIEELNLPAKSLKEATESLQQTKLLLLGLSKPMQEILSGCKEAFSSPTLQLQSHEPLPSESFDIGVGALPETFSYDNNPIFDQIFMALKPAAKFIFSLPLYASIPLTEKEKEAAEQANMTLSQALTNETKPTPIAFQILEKLKESGFQLIKPSEVNPDLPLPRVIVMVKKSV